MVDLLALVCIAGGSVMYRVASLLAIGLLNGPAQADQIVSNLTEPYNFGAGLGVGPGANLGISGGFDVTAGSHSFG